MSSPFQAEHVAAKSSYGGRFTCRHGSGGASRSLAFVTEWEEEEEVGEEEEMEKEEGREGGRGGGRRRDKKNSSSRRLKSSSSKLKQL